MLHSNLSYSNHSVKELELPRNELEVHLEKALHEIKVNLDAIMQIDAITELNIGQSIIARSVFTGLADAVQDMKKLTTR